MLSTRIQKNLDSVAGFFLFSMFPGGIYLSCLDALNYSVLSPLIALWLACNVNASTKALPAILLVNWLVCSQANASEELLLLSTGGVLFMWVLQKITKEISF